MPSRNAGAFRLRRSSPVTLSCPSPQPASADAPAGTALVPMPTASTRPTPPASAGFDAVIFDMDGVLTDTAAVHSAAWKRTFDTFLERRARQTGQAFQEFTHATDYLAYVDGRPRFAGVEAFLASRGVRLPWGDPDDPTDADTVCGLGNRKNELFNALVAAEGVRVHHSTVALIHALRAAGLGVGLATSSRNAALLLRLTGTRPLFGSVIDGRAAEQRGLRGKPHPDTFLAACAELGVAPARAIVVEDAVSGVQAGVSGGFALVVGVAREGNAATLHAHGADLVVTDLAEVSVEHLDRKVRLRAAGA